MLDVEEGQINKELDNPDLEMMYPKKVAEKKARLGEIRALRDTEFANETAAINKLRTGGAPGQHPAPTVPSGGSGSITYTPEMTDSERDIMRMSQEIADAEGLKRPQMAGAKQPKTVTFGPQNLVPAPAKEQRVVGQSYLLPNGKTGVWRGTGWEVQ
jgi:hypothetical protein